MRAFAVDAMPALDEVEHVRDALTASVEAGQSFEQFRARLRALLETVQ